MVADALSLSICSTDTFFDCTRRQSDVTFQEWTSPLRNGQITQKPPFQYFLLSTKSETIVSNTGEEAKLHRVTKMSSFVLQLVYVAATLGFIVLCIVGGALSFSARRLIVGAVLICALVPLVVG